MSASEFHVPLPVIASYNQREEIRQIFK